MSKRRKAVFVTGTDTEIGKTVISCGIVHGLKKKGIDCGVMKPVQCAGDDAVLLKKIANQPDPIELINPYYFKHPLSPHLAAKLERKKISIKKILNAYHTLLSKYEFLVVEGAGGLLVPIKENFLIADLIRELNIPAIIVSRLALGTINHTLLTIEAAKKYGIEIIGIVFNQAEKSPITICERTNPEIIHKLSKVPVIGIVTYLSSVSYYKKNSLWVEKVAKKINLDLILKEKKLKSYRQLSNYDRNIIWHPYTQMKDYIMKEPIIIKSGKGSYIEDINGNKYIDGVSSIWVNVHGHRKKEIDIALKEQIDKISHSTLLGLGNVPSIELAKKLIEIVPKGLEKVFYSDNGSTAVEIALKIAFQYWQHKGEMKKTKFVSFYNAYHGDTIGAVSVGGIELFCERFSPLLFETIKIKAPYCYRCHLNLKYPDCVSDGESPRCLDELENALAKHHTEIAGLIIEPLVQAAAGMITHPDGYLKKVRELCTKYNVLMIADEVATGFGRTGKMFACEWEGVSPDILCLAKSITGGYLPLAATITTEEIYSVFLGEYSEKKTFFHGHTYTGNPLACACAIANIEIFKRENTLQKLKPKIEFLKKSLEKFKLLEHVGDIRQKGFIVGIELVKNKLTKEPYLFEEKIGIRVIEEARKYGVILRPLGNVIVLFPPLSIEMDELKTLLDVTYLSIKKVTS